MPSFVHTECNERLFGNVFKNRMPQGRFDIFITKPRRMLALRFSGCACTPVFKMEKRRFSSADAASERS